MNYIKLSWMMFSVAVTIQTVASLIMVVCASLPLTVLNHRVFLVATRNRAPVLGLLVEGLMVVVVVYENGSNLEFVQL